MPNPFRFSRIYLWSALLVNDASFSSAVGSFNYTGSARDLPGSAKRYIAECLGKERGEQIDPDRVVVLMLNRA